MAANTSEHGSIRLQREVIKVFLKDWHPRGFPTVLIPIQSLLQVYSGEGKNIIYLDRNGNYSFLNLLKGILLWLFKLFTPILITFDATMTTTVIRVSLILKLIYRYYDLVCTFNTYIQMHFTNFKLIVGPLPGSHYYSFYVKKNMTRG